ncbi:hypothetical protein PMI08_01105 [Brevibacillus sp. CF112]|uniref:hypothetical protein n=1 Tax=Brevibacillus TaxID=55080 RepID=UPI0002716DC4|nr:hypothetical protein [Brevibacillus sp. CF112]EJL46610.1 hypothetical protein PMI08_01105 [Brevibacillus sp. CF112]
MANQMNSKPEMAFVSNLSIESVWMVYPNNKEVERSYPEGLDGMSTAFHVRHNVYYEKLRNDDLPLFDGTIPSVQVLESVGELGTSITARWSLRENVGFQTIRHRANFLKKLETKVRHLGYFDVMESDFSLKDTIGQLLQLYIDDVLKEEKLLSQSVADKGYDCWLISADEPPILTTLSLS